MPSVPEYQLNAEMIHDMRQQTVQDHLSLEVDGYQCDSEMLGDVLLKAASENSTVEATCIDWGHVADSNTIR